MSSDNRISTDQEVEAVTRGVETPLEGQLGVEVRTRGGLAQTFLVTDQG